MGEDYEEEEATAVDDIGKAKVFISEKDAEASQEVGNWNNDYKLKACRRQYDNYQEIIWQIHIVVARASWWIPRFLKFIIIPQKHIRLTVFIN